jgi:hypothetical protein
MSVETNLKMMIDSTAGTATSGIPRKLPYGGPGKYGYPT